MMLDETPLVESQEISEKDEAGFRIIRATISNTWQLRWWVLSKGQKIEVLAPETFRKEIKVILSEAKSHYI